MVKYILQFMCILLTGGKISKLKKDSLKLEDQLCFPLYVASRKVISLYHPYLKPLNITYTQYIVFMALWNNERMTVSELGKMPFLDNGTLTPLLKKMEAQGYITRTRSDKDERVMMISLTEAGWQMKEKCRDIQTSVEDSVDIDPDNSQDLYALLYSLRKKVSDK